MLYRLGGTLPDQLQILDSYQIGMQDGYLELLPLHFHEAGSNGYKYFVKTLDIEENEPLQLGPFQNLLVARSLRRQQ